MPRPGKQLRTSKPRTKSAQLMARPSTLVALGAVLAILMSASAALADSASIVVTDGGSGAMSATVTVTSTSCTQGVDSTVPGIPAVAANCSWMASVSERHSSLSCRQDDVFFLALAGYAQTAGSTMSTFTFYPFFPRATKLCVFLSNAAGTRAIAEPVVSLPAGYGWQKSSRFNCSSFRSQAAAQYYLELYPTDPSRLDADHDQSACETNPCPCGAEGIPAEPEPVPAVSEPTPTHPKSRCNPAKHRIRIKRARVRVAQKELRRTTGSPAAQWWRLRLHRRRDALRGAEEVGAQLCATSLAANLPG